MPKTNTKDRLIDTAVEMIWKSSYGSVSVDDICKEADVRKGSFYHYFKSKADLAVEAMEKHYQSSTVGFDAAFSPSLAPLERFDRMVTLICEKQRQAVKEHGHVCGCPFATLGSEMAGQEDVIRAKADDIFRRYLRYYENAIRDLVAEGLVSNDINIESRAEEISSYACGQAIMARVHNSLEPLERDLKTGIYRLLGINNDSLN